jgi:hypothetical protein
MNPGASSGLFDGPNTEELNLTLASIVFVPEIVNATMQGRSFTRRRIKFHDISGKTGGKGVKLLTPSS